MSKILYLARSGSGKSSSLRNLNPSETAIINIDKKELPLKNWRSNYVTIRDSVTGKVDWTKSNYVETSNPDSVQKALTEWQTCAHIKNIVVDTITHMITFDYMTNTIGKDFKTYQKMGLNFFKIVDVFPKDKNLIILAHVEEKLNDMGDKTINMKSYGNMISAMEPESYFTTVLIGEIQRDPASKKASYVCRTQSLGNDPAKSPAVFNGDDAETVLDMYEPNDIKVILDKLATFEIGPTV